MHLNHERQISRLWLLKKNKSKRFDIKTCEGPILENLELQQQNVKYSLLSLLISVKTLVSDKQNIF